MAIQREVEQGPTGACMLGAARASDVRRQSQANGDARGAETKVEGGTGCLYKGRKPWARKSIDGWTVMVGSV